MNWDLIGIIPPILMGLFILVLLWGSKQMWDINNKFLSFIFGALAVVLGVLLYAMYGHKIFG